ncbi:hypothetical protein BH09ACT1_BH09ACT1_01690 [soil metagenome]
MNRRSELVISCAALLIVGASLSACSSTSESVTSSGSESDVADRTPKKTRSPEPSPTPVVDLNLISLTDTWSSKVGYAYSLKVDRFTATTSVDTANALPGKSIVTYAYTVTGSLTNSTPERIAPFPVASLVEPIWSASSPVCIALPGQSNQAFNSNDPGQEEKACSVVPDGSNFSTTGTTGTIGVGATVPVQAVFGYKISVDEATAYAVAAELKTPEIWVLARNVGEGWQTSCLVRSGAYYVTQSTGITGCHA